MIAPTTHIHPGDRSLNVTGADARRSPEPTGWWPESRSGQESATNAAAAVQELCSVYRVAQPQRCRGAEV